MRKLFVLGDSISCYYGKYLSEMLRGFCQYDRKGGSHCLKELDDCTDGINAGDSRMVLQYLRSVTKMDFFHPDYLLLNCGLHDTKRPRGKLQVPLEEYQQNLKTVIDLMQKHNISLIWVRITSVNPNTPQMSQEEIHQRQSDIDACNICADRLMNHNAVSILDLDRFTRNLGDDIYLNGKDSVHFNETAAALQAAFLCGNLQQLMR